MAGTWKIAILLKYQRRLDDALRCAKVWAERGAKVSFLCLCRSQCQREDWNVQPLLDLDAECYTDDIELAHRFNLDCLSMASVASYLKSVDWVIPF